MSHGIKHRVNYFLDGDTCFFVVWTTKETTVLLIKRDETWAENIDILSEFYFAKLFQKTVGGEL